jgi:hypothetical protein
MRWLSSSSKALNKKRWTSLDFASLQFRLMAIVVATSAIVLTVYIILCHQEIQRLVIMQPERLPTSQFLVLADQFTRLGLLAISGMMVLIVAAIWILLRPLQDFTQWIVASSMSSHPHSFNALHAPSELKLLAHQWHQMLARLAAVKHQQRQFTNDLAHELRSPLSLVYGYLQRTLKRSQHLTKAQQESLAMAATEAERMTLILQDLIELARAESLDLVSAQEPLILNRLLAKVRGMSRSRSRR